MIVWPVGIEGHVRPMLLGLRQDTRHILKSQTKKKAWGYCLLVIGDNVSDADLLPILGCPRGPTLEGLVELPSKSNSYRISETIERLWGTYHVESWS